MSYPSAIDSFSPRTDNVDDVMAADVNELQSAITNIETELGENPAGTADDLVTRLAQSLDGLGNLSLASATTLTMSSHAITVTQNYHRVDTESGASIDNLTTINGVTVEGFFLILRPLSGSRSIVIQHNAGNILCAGSVDIVLIHTYDFAILIYDASLSVWIASPTGYEGLGTLTGNNTWSGPNTWTATENHKYSAVSTDTLLSSSYYYAVDVNAAGGNRTINLPSAAATGVLGRTYIIRKNDSSTNHVFVSANGSETINGAAYQELTTQYQSITIMSTGAAWMIV